MQQKLICIFLLALTVSAELPTVTELNIQAYLGNWYEVVSSPIVHLTFERQSFCDRATYSLRADGTINVRNVDRKPTPDGAVDEIVGFAYQSDPVNFPGKLRVNFGNESNYWIVRTGPIVNGKYDYSIVSEPTRQFMWVLARDVNTYWAKYGEANKEYLTKELNFTGTLNKYQDRSWVGCVPFDDEY